MILTERLEGEMKMTLQKSNEEWQKILSPDEYRITRQGGTEPPFSGELLHNKETGEYTCTCCGKVLFDSKTKFDSGSGWPSFYQSHSEEAIDKKMDAQGGMMRTEITCSNCHAHLGHVFDDGPGPTGLRYCVNSKALKFKKT